MRAEHACAARAARFFLIQPIVSLLSDVFVEKK